VSIKKPRNRRVSQSRSSQGRGNLFFNPNGGRKKKLSLDGVELFAQERRKGGNQLCNRGEVGAKIAKLEASRSGKKEGKAPRRKKISNSSCSLRRERKKKLYCRGERPAPSQRKRKKTKRSSRATSASACGEGRCRSAKKRGVDDRYVAGKGRVFAGAALPKG